MLAQDLQQQCELKTKLRTGERIRVRSSAIKRLEVNHLANPDYDPNRLLDELLRLSNLKGDAKLAVELLVDPAVISKLRHRHGNLTPALLLRIHDVFGIEIDELRRLAGIATQ